MGARDDYPFGEHTAAGGNTILPLSRWDAMCDEIDRLREEIIALEKWNQLLLADISGEVAP